MYDRLADYQRGGFSERLNGFMLATTRFNRIAGSDNFLEPAFRQVNYGRQHWIEYRRLRAITSAPF